MKLHKMLKPYRMTYNRSVNAYYCVNVVRDMVFHVFKKLGYHIVDFSHTIGGQSITLYDEYEDDIYCEIVDSEINVMISDKIKNTKHVDKLLGTLEVKLKNKYGFKLNITSNQ